MEIESILALFDQNPSYDDAVWALELLHDWLKAPIEADYDDDSYDERIVRVGLMVAERHMETSWPTEEQEPTIRDWLIKQERMQIVIHIANTMDACLTEEIVKQLIEPSPICLDFIFAGFEYAQNLEAWDPENTDHYDFYCDLVRLLSTIYENASNEYRVTILVRHYTQFIRLFHYWNIGVHAFYLEFYPFYVMMVTTPSILHSIDHSPFKNKLKYLKGNMEVIGPLLTYALDEPTTDHLKTLLEYDLLLSAKARKKNASLSSLFDRIRREHPELLDKYVTRTEGGARPTSRAGRKLKKVKCGLCDQ